MYKAKNKLGITPKVSVIVPVYNSENYLRPCLDSIVFQTLKEIEIIVIDDGSTDGSLDILREYEKNDSRFVVFEQTHMNAGAARNKGLVNARGEYLAFLDSDDFFEQDMLEKAYNVAMAQKADVVVFKSDAYDVNTNLYEQLSFTIRYENLPNKAVFSGTEIKRELFSTFVGWTWDKVFLREYVTKNKIYFQEQRTTNDLLFTYMALAQAERITIIGDILAHHRIHITTSLESTRAKSFRCFYQALLALREELKRKRLYVRFERDFINYSLCFSLENLRAMPTGIKKQLYRCLKTEWFKNLEITGHYPDFFYHKNDYLQYRLIMAFQYDGYVLVNKYIEYWRLKGHFIRSLMRSLWRTKEVNTI